MKLLVLAASALLVAACSSLSDPGPTTPREARMSPGGKCLLESSPCTTYSSCCSGFCAAGECTTRDP
jgi:hypothetical protein